MMKKYKCKICGHVIESKQKLDKNFSCPMCEVSGDLFVEVQEKQELKEKENDIIQDKNDRAVRISKSNPAITKVVENCINCGICKKTCREVVGIRYEDDEVKTPVCIHCGQCVTHCPKDAIRPKQTYRYLKELLEKKEKIMVVSTAPAVRVALAEEFGYEVGTFAEGKMISALRKLGFDYVLDITFGADLTIMEEAQEFLNRIQSGNHLPQFTSCCPSWVKYAEIYYPELLPYLSSCKSPIGMQGSIIKTYFAEKKKISPCHIVNVVVAPCTAKKYEIQRKEMENVSRYLEIEGIRDNDYVITTTELAKMIKEASISFDDLEEGSYDSILGKGSGAGVIFGNTGGVMQAALRNVYYHLTGKNPPERLLHFEVVRGLEGVKEATVTIQNMKIKVAVVQGLTNIPAIVEKLKQNELDYRFIEVMNCKGGCIGGGGQPIHIGMNKDEIRLKRIQGLYQEDDKLTYRSSYENSDIKRIYHEFLKKPCSKKSEALLHTKYASKTHIYFK